MQRVLLLPVLIFVGRPAHAFGGDDDPRVAPPRVVSVSPGIGASNVSPNVSELRVQFDIAMNIDGYSFVGGGPSFPQPTGRPRWVDAYTCVLPVRLKPHWDYAFSINGPSHNNFKSIDLVPAEPLDCSFRTGGDGAIERSPDGQRKENLASFDALCDAMRRGYSYWEVRGLDWESLFAEFREGAVTAENTRSWTRHVAGMLARADDLHLWLEFDGELFATAKRDIKPNYSRDAVLAVIPNLSARGETVAAGSTDDGIGYVLIETWAAERSAELARIPEIISAMAPMRGLILDVRPNAGGSESLALRIARMFVDEPCVYARNVFRRGPEPGDFTPPRDRTIEPGDPAQRFKGRVAVLMGPANTSSCESFLLMMRHCAGARLFGDRSYGSSGNPKPAYLPNGVKLFIPSWKDMAPDGELVEGRGVSPDVEVKAGGDVVDVGDPIVTRALQWLRATDPPADAGR